MRFEQHATDETAQADAPRQDSIAHWQVVKFEHIG